MNKRLKLAAIVVGVLVAVFAAAQLIRPERTNPATDASKTIQAQAGTSSELVAVLNRACTDCHSNETVWSRYSEVAPMSWLAAYGVAEGRKAVNFSEWTTYPPDQQQKLLAESCEDAISGKMPSSLYTMLYPEAQLSTQDVETICAVTR